MTLIAFATYGDHAEFITDTASYTRYVETMGKTTKHLTLNHLDAAVLTQGNSRFGDAVKAGSLQAGGQVASFDELVRTAPDWIREQRQQVVVDGVQHVDGTVFFIGWSDERGEFAAYYLASEEDFRIRRVIRPFVTPCPWKYAPSRIEAIRAHESMGDDPQREEFMTTWATKPILQPPADLDAWLDLALAAREQRALNASFLHVIVAGAIHHTRLDRGAVTSRKIHEFTDAGEGFQQLIAFTRHPQAQTMPCWCDSGQTFVDCHLAEDLDDECGCGSRKSFRECCWVQAADPVSA